METGFRKYKNICEMIVFKNSLASKTSKLQQPRNINVVIVAHYKLPVEDRFIFSSLKSGGQETTREVATYLITVGINPVFDLPPHLFSF